MVKEQEAASEVCQQSKRTTHDACESPWQDEVRRFLRTRYGAASSFALELSGKAWQDGLVDDAPRAGDAGRLWGTKRVGHENIKLWDGARLHQLKLQDIRMFFSTLTLPWTLSRMCCWLSPAALVARQVYFPESSSFAFVTFSVLPADSSCGKQKHDEKDGTDTFSYIYAVYRNSHTVWDV